MNEATISVSDFLNELFQKRRSLNPRYSQRAFARDLGLSSGRLSEYLSDKNIPGPSSIEALRTRLSLDDQQYKALLQAVEHSKSISAEKSKPVVLAPHHLAQYKQSTPILQFPGSTSLDLHDSRLHLSITL
ncbi:helix-turn-helix domain-containing protein [Bdellovibrio svalbardensis]|uniref:Helix-turn-helix transcriptional regulator n=1 Tax=Bdellovibrio svalbardensis TaxID=2972972 RepID=A0ABT6DLA5_9BACT|nr:helix-turn-helix transcriptional regulator [Bdellovibrio svalbardensis]MDG0817664.1 helix-turn-helix transcriptional regulator [Bdellovibrio svalbardensis]